MCLARFIEESEYMGAAKRIFPNFLARGISLEAGKDCPYMTNNTVRFLFRWGIYALIAGIFLTCQPFTQRPNPVDQACRIPLRNGGPHDLAWNTKDLTLDYRYLKREDALTFTGIAALTGGLKEFELVDQFDIKIHFLDEEGRTVKEQFLFSTGYRKENKPFEFQNKLTAPLEAHSFALSYAGKARGPGWNAPAWEFWDRRAE
jgi:hypothetical protein